MKNLHPLYIRCLLAVCLFVNLASITNATPNLASNPSEPNKDFISVQNAWVRATSAGQDVGAAYMTLTSTQNLDILSIESNVTKIVEIHNMTMENGVMKMRMLDKLALSAGKPYKLEPGGFHLMLFDLKKPLVVGEKVSFTLSFKVKNDKNKPEMLKQTIQAKVQSSAQQQHKH